MKKLYPNSTQLSAPDFGINLVPFPTNMTPDIIAYAESHLTEKALELQRAGFSTKNTTGLPADYTGSTSATPSAQWEQLIIPTGAVKGTNNLPLIVPSNPLSFKVQNFLGANFYNNRGFSVNPTENIIDLSAKISTTWEGGLKNEMDRLLDVYKNLDDRKKVIAEFLRGLHRKRFPQLDFSFVSRSSCPRNTSNRPRTTSKCILVWRPEYLMRE